MEIFCLSLFSLSRRALCALPKSPPALTTKRTRIFLIFSERWPPKFVAQKAKFLLFLKKKPTGARSHITLVAALDRTPHPPASATMVSSSSLSSSSLRRFNAAVKNNVKSRRRSGEALRFLSSNEKRVGDRERRDEYDANMNEKNNEKKINNKSKMESAKGDMRSRRDFVSLSSLAVMTTSLSCSATFAEKAEAAREPFCGYYADIDSPVSQAAYQSTFSEGYVNNLQTFVRQVGKVKRGNKTCLPVLVIHDQRLDMKYLEAIEILAFTPDDFRREIFFYDQLNRGKSKHKLNANVDDFLLEELAGVRKDCGLAEEGIHIIAHGTGCELALRHALQGKNLVHSLTLIGAGSSSERNQKDFESKRIALGDSISTTNDDFYERYWTNRGKSGTCFSNATSALDVSSLENDWDVKKLLKSVNNEIPDALRGIRVVRGVNDVISEANAKDLVSTLNEAKFENKSKVRNSLCSFDNNVEDAASCVHLDRAEYFLDTTSTYILKIEEELVA